LQLTRPVVIKLEKCGNDTESNSEAAEGKHVIQRPTFQSCRYGLKFERLVHADEFQADCAASQQRVFVLKLLLYYKMILKT